MQQRIDQTIDLRTRPDAFLDIQNVKIHLSNDIPNHQLKDQFTQTLLQQSLLQLGAVRKQGPSAQRAVQIYYDLIKSKDELTLDEALDIKTIELEQNDQESHPPSFKEMLTLVCKNDLIELNLSKNIQKSFLILKKISDKMQLSNPLLIATFLNKLKLCQYLVEDLNFNVNKQTKHEAPPLLYTVLNNSWECFLYLLQKGANVNATNKAKQTILFLVAKYSNPKFLQILIQYGVDVNHRDSSGRTSLYSAAVHGNLSVLKILVQNGGNLDTKDNIGGTLYHAACINGHQNICDYLMSQRVKIQCSNNNTDPCDLLMYHTNKTNLYSRMIRYKKKF